MPPKRQLPSNLDFEKFLEKIDQNVELRGMRVVFYDGDVMHIVREGPPMCAVGLKTIVIKPDLGENTVQSAPAAQGRESRLYSELLSLGLGCGGAVIGWLVVGGSAGAAPITGGSSTFITYLALGGAVSGTAQCANSLVRVKNELSSPERNDHLDSLEWYTTTSTVLDIISLAGTAASVGATIRMAKALKATTGKTMIEVLKGLTRQQRKALAEETVRAANPGISNKMLKAYVAAGKYPKRFTNEAISIAVRNQLKDALNAAMSFVGSAMSGVVRQVSQYVVGIAQSVETY